MKEIHGMISNANSDGKVVHQPGSVDNQELSPEEVLARFDHLIARLKSQNADYSEAEVTADIATARLERAN